MQFGEATTKNQMTPERDRETSSIKNKTLYFTWLIFNFKKPGTYWIGDSRVNKEQYRDVSSDF